MFTSAYCRFKISYCVKPNMWERVVENVLLFNFTLFKKNLKLAEDQSKTDFRPSFLGISLWKKNRDVQRRQDTKQLTENSPLCRISHIADLPGPVLNPSKDLRSHLGWTSLITPDKAVITDPYPSPSLWWPHTQPSAKYKIRLVFPMWARPWTTVLIHLSR